IEICFIKGPCAVYDPGATRDGDEVGRGRARGRLRARDLIDAVVPHNDRKILRCTLGHGRETPELHQQRAVAFERDDVATWLRDGDAECDGDGEAHAAEHVE